MREPKLIIATGTKGVGKTYASCKLIEQYLTPNLDADKKARKVLIYDVNQEYTNEQLIENGHRFRTKTLALKDLPAWVQSDRIEVRRILPVDAYGQTVGTDKMPDILNIILHYYRGGLLVLEDINRYLIYTSDSNIIGTMATNRHRDLDILIHLQSLSPVTPRMWQNCNAIRFHYQTDDVDRISNRVNYTLFKIAQLLVDEQFLNNNKRFYCWVLVDENKIRGEFSKKMFINACRQYYEQNPAELRRFQIKYGKDNEARIRAMKEGVAELMRKYFGNKENLN